MDGAGICLANLATKGQKRERVLSMCATGIGGPGTMTRVHFPLSTVFFQFKI
jgi:hypothetical protein